MAKFSLYKSRVTIITAALSASESHSSKSDIATIEPNIKLFMFAAPFFIKAESTAVSPIPADIITTVAIS